MVAMINELRDEFHYILIDSPAGIETGALMAMHFADEALVVTNPEVSSVRDSDRILGIIQAKSRRALLGGEPVKEHLLITRYSPKRVMEGEMLSFKDVQEILRVPIIGTYLLAAPRLFREGLLRSARRATYFNFELHGIDLIGAEEDGIPPSLVAKQPDLRVPLVEKQRALEAALDRLADGFTFEPIRDAAERFATA